MFDTALLQRITISVIGAILLSAACVAGAAAPGRAAAAPVHKAPATGLVGALRY